MSGPTTPAPPGRGDSPWSRLAKKARAARLAEHPPEPGLPSPDSVDASTKTTTLAIPGGLQIGRGTRWGVIAAVLAGTAGVSIFVLFWIVSLATLVGTFAPLVDRHRHIGPTVVNAAAKKRGTRVSWVTAATLVLGVILLTSEVEWIKTVAIVAWGIGMALYSPATLAALLAVATMRFGGGSTIFAAPAIVMLARSDRRKTLQLPRTIVGALTTLLMAFLAFLSAIIFWSVTLGTPDAGGGGAEGAAGGFGDAEPIQGDSLSGRALRWLFDLVGIDGSSPGGEEPGRPIDVPSQRPEPDDPTNWWPWVLLALAVLVLAALAYWWWRRRNRDDDLDDDGAPEPARPIARLEALGSELGRPREAHEGALTYADALAERTGDERLTGTGDLVSGQVFASRRVDPVQVDRHLGGLEAEPPTVPKETVGERLSRWAAWPRAHWRGMALTLGSVGALVAVAFFAAPYFSSFKDEPPEQLAYDAVNPYGQPTVPDPAELGQFLTLDDGEIVGFEICEVETHDDEPWLDTTVGLVALDGSGAFTRSTHVTHDGPLTDSRFEFHTQNDRWILNGDVRTFASDRQWTVASGIDHALAPFEDLDAVLDAYGTVEPIVTEHTGRDGSTFVRYESMPRNYTDEDFDETWFEYDSVHGMGWRQYEYQWVLDIWLDDDGVPVRVRRLVDNPRRTWNEWRRVEAATSDTPLLTPDCPLTFPTTSSDWEGWVDWTPSRVVPPRIEFDRAGNPIDSSPWLDWTADESTSDTIGTIAEPVDRLVVDDWFWLVEYEEDWGPREAATQLIDVAWPDGFTIEQHWTDDWPSAVRIDALHTDAPVASWSRGREVWTSESFVVLVLETEPLLEDRPRDDLPLQSFDEIDELVGPLWEGEDLVALDRDDDGATETVVLSHSEVQFSYIGSDADGNQVSIVFVGYDMAWRSFSFEGEPPPEVVEREAQLRSCLAGERELDAAGYCVRDADDS